MEEKEKEKNIKGNKFSKNTSLFIFVLIFIMGWFFVSKNSFGEMNIFEDKDQDGLADREEYMYNTDPDNPDTDGDGYKDGEEVESGFNPLIPAPGDKIVENVQVEGEFDEKDPLEGDVNLTDEVLNELQESKGGELSQLGSILKNPELLNDPDVLESLQELSITSMDMDSVYKEAFQVGDASEEIELISEEEIKILDKPTGTKEKVEKEEKKQVQEYLTSLAYISLNSSLVDIGSSGEITQLMSSFALQMITLVDAGNLKELKTIREKTERSYEEMLEVEVPYVLKDVHILGTSLFKYSLENLIEEKVLDSSDPVEMLLVMSKGQAVLMELENLKSQLIEIISEYEIDSIDLGADFQGHLENFISRDDD